MTIPGATTEAVFVACVEQVLGPPLSPGTVVVMDHLGAHKVSGLFARLVADRTVLRSSGRLCGVRRHARMKRLDAALAEAWESVTASDVRGWFAHCGYPI